MNSTLMLPTFSGIFISALAPSALRMGFPNLRAESRNRLRCAPWAERRGNGRRGSAPAGSQVVRMSGLQARPLGDGTSVGTLAHSSREVQPETNGRTSPVYG